MPPTNQVIDNLEGSSSVEMQIILDDDSTISLNKILGFRKLTTLETVHGTTRYEFSLQVQNPQVVNRVIRAAMASGTPRFRVRIGYGKPTQILWMPWQDHIIVEYIADLESIGNQSGHTVLLVTSDAFYQAQRASKTRSHKGLISSMVERIAADNELQSVIEPTKGEFLFLQSYEDDIGFVRSRLLLRAINGKNRGNYLFYMRDNVLHFHSPDYQTEVKEWHYYNAPHRVLSQKDNSQTLWDEGISGIRMISYDPLTGSTQEISSSPDNTLRLADSIYDLPSVNNGEHNVTFHIGSNSLEEAVNLSQNFYSWARQRTFQITSTFTRTVNIRIGDIVKLIITPDRETSPWSGFYLVDKLIYEVEQGSILGTFDLVRGEIRKDLSNIAAQGAEQILVPVLQAPGQDLNVVETQASSRTKGVGKTGPGVIYTEVSDPNSAP